MFNNVSKYLKIIKSHSNCSEKINKIISELIAEEQKSKNKKSTKHIKRIF